MAKPARKARRTTARRSRTGLAVRSAAAEPSADAIKAAEQVALSAFASGLKLAAAFGTVAAKTTSLALASLATGADKFSELVKKEALASSHNQSAALGIESRKARSNRRRPSSRRAWKVET